MKAESPSKQVEVEVQFEVQRSKAVKVAKKVPASSWLSFKLKPILAAITLGLAFTVSLP